MPEHITLPYRKTVVARSLIAYTLAIPAAADPKLARIADLLSNSAKRPLDSFDLEPLDRFLRTLSIEAEEMIAREFPSSPIPPVLEQLITQFRSIDCHRCAGSSEICCGDPVLDDGLVSNDGWCFTWFHEALGYVLNLCDYHYRGYGSPPDFIVATQHTPETPPFPECSAATGLTRPDDSAASKTNLLEYLVHSELTDYDTVCATPFVLMHEVFCHGFQSILGPPRTAIGNQCSWTEGWMDAVAFKVLWDALEFGIPTPPRWMDQRIDDIQSSAARLHRARTDPLHLTTNTTTRQREKQKRAQRQTARETFNALVRFWRAIDFGASGDEKSIKLSIIVNVDALKTEERQRLVERLSLLLWDQSSRLETLLTLEIYLEDKDWEKLQSGLANISQ